MLTVIQLMTGWPQDTFVTPRRGLGRGLFVLAFINRSYSMYPLTLVSTVGCTNPLSGLYDPVS